jgi:hypothetical protein
MGFLRENFFSIFLIGFSITIAIATIVTVSLVSQNSGYSGTSSSTEVSTTDDDGSGEGELPELLGKVTVDTSDGPELIDLYSEGLMRVVEHRKTGGS